MAENKRMTISIPAEMEEALTELRKTDRFCRSSYAEIVREVLKIGVERINNPIPATKYCDSAYNVKTAFKAFKDDGAGYPFSKPGGISSNSSGWLSDIQGTNEGGFVGKVFSGSATSHWADRSYLCAGYCAYFGGHWNDGDYAGPFWINVGYAASHSYSDLGARLMYKHTVLRLPGHLAGHNNYSRCIGRLEINFSSSKVRQ